MAISVDRFVVCLSDSGLLSPEEVASIRASVPKGETDVKALAATLVRQRKLTQYQAQVLASGQTHGLIYGEYTVTEKLGEGGMGVVFRTQHRRLRRPAALKVLHPTVTKSEEAVKRFRREIEASSILSHPNIVAAYDANEQDGNYFFVMELVEGIDLYRLVKRDGPVSVTDALDYILQAARGLDHAHKKGIIHRDIKPSNLLLDNAGTIKILDMGLARFIDPSSNGDQTQSEHLTETGEILGSFDYMAPEQAIDTKRVDHRADIYSLGCTLFFLLSGRAPYQGETTMQKLLAHRELAIPSLRRVQGNVPLALEAVFQRMLAKHADDRYSAMSELIHDLETCRLELLNLSSTVEPIHKPVPRSLILSGTLIILAVLGSHHYLTYEAARHGWAVTDQVLFVRWYHLLAGLGMFTGIGMVLIGVLMSAVAGIGSALLPAPTRGNARQVRRAQLLARRLLGALVGFGVGLLSGAIIGTSLAQHPSLTVRIVGGGLLGAFVGFALFGLRMWFVAVACAVAGALFGNAIKTLVVPLERIGLAHELTGDQLATLLAAVLGALVGMVWGGRFASRPPRVKAKTRVPAHEQPTDSTGDDDLADKATVRRPRA